MSTHAGETRVAKGSFSSR